MSEWLMNIWENAKMNSSHFSTNISETFGIDWDTETLSHQDVLSFGDKVEVLEPKELREEMKGIVEKLNKIYK